MCLFQSIRRLWSGRGVIHTTDSTRREVFSRYNNCTKRSVVCIQDLLGVTLQQLASQSGVTCDNETSLGNFPVTLRSCIPRDTGECATLVPYRTRLFAYLMPPGVFLRLKMDDESTVTSGAPSFSSFYYTQLCQANLIYGRCLLFLIYLI